MTKDKDNDKDFDLGDWENDKSTPKESEAKMASLAASMADASVSPHTQPRLAITIRNPPSQATLNALARDTEDLPSPSTLARGSNSPPPRTADARSDHRHPSMKEVEGALEAALGVLRRDGRENPSADLGDGSIVLPPKKQNYRKALLVAALFAGGVGVALLFLTPAVNVVGPSRSLLQGDADAIAQMIEGTVHAAQMRADGIGQTPMLRAAIETDADTVKDMVRGSDFIFTSNKGDIAELFQLHDGVQTSLLQVPSTGHTITPPPRTKSRLETDGTEIRIIVGAPVMTQKLGLGGTVALSVPLDLAPIKQRVSGHAIEATIVGLPSPIVLASASTVPGSTKATLPINFGRELALSLSLTAVIAPVPINAQKNLFDTARLISWGVGGLLLLIYFAALLRRRAMR